MARKKKGWREIDDPAEIFGDGHRHDREEIDGDRAFDAFRRHIEEHIQGETRAFHELRSAAEHELQTSIVTNTPRRPEPRPAPTQQPKALPPPLPPAAVMQAMPKSKGLSTGTAVMLSLIFAAIGFLLHSAWQQAQPLTRKNSVAAAKPKVDANCVSEKLPAPKKVVAKAPEAAPVVAPVPVPAMTPTPVPTPSMEATAVADPSLRGMTTRAAELRKGPGSGFEIVDSLPPGFAVEGSLTTDRQWLRVKPGAFVAVEAVQFQDGAAAPSFQSYWVGQNVANVREFPLLSAKVLRKADPGAELKLQGFNAEWAAVQGGGFVFRKLVTDQAPRLLQLPALMRVTVEKAEIRGGPGMQYPILGMYFRNHKVEVQDIQGGWLRVGADQYIRVQELELSAKPNADKTM